MSGIWSLRPSNSIVPIVVPVPCAPVPFEARETTRRRRRGLRARYPLCDAASAARPVTEVFTDGSSLGNPGPGGWAFVVDGGPWACGCEPRTTNQRMELTAAARAVAALGGPLRVMSDSKYVVDCFRDRWWEGWLRRGWTNSKKQPVANRDLWEPFIEAVRERADVEFEWVPGHAGNPMNEAADRLAAAAAAAQDGS
ncbi:MAG TPA: ribonuclease H, partial [Acidimicrobiaceae bacterium]|nr:ribonuclease H [Acidimicrobiaceae bacterium]